MDSLTFLQNASSNINSTILSLLNLVLFVELTVACCWGMYQAGTIGEATAAKIALLSTIVAIMFRFWQSWPSEWAWFAVLPMVRVLGVCWGVSRLHFQVGFPANSCSQLIS